MSPLVFATGLVQVVAAIVAHQADRKRATTMELPMLYLSPIMPEQSR